MSNWNTHGRSVLERCGGISFVIPSARPTVFLPAIIRTLTEQCRRGACPIEIIVVLDANGVGFGPSEDLQAVSSSEVVSIVSTTGSQGPAAARNLGAARARHTHLCFLDDDVIPGVNFVCALADVLPQHEQEAVLCRVLHHPSILTCSTAKRYRSTWLGLPDKLVRYSEGARLSWRLMQACALVMDRRQFHSMGGFNELFRHPHYEDLDLAARFHEEGGTLRLARRPAVFHYGYHSVVGHLHWCAKNGYWKRVFCEMHPSLAKEALHVVRNPLGTMKLTDVILSARQRSVLISRLALLNQKQSLSSRQQLVWNAMLALLGVDCERRAFVRRTWSVRSDQMIHELPEVCALQV